MDPTKDDKVRTKAYELWEKEGRPEGRHDEHWAEAERHVGMMGDGTQEQSLGQPGDSGARITEDEVKAAFSQAPGSPAKAAR